MTSKSVNNSDSSTPIRFQRFLLNHPFKRIGFIIAAFSFVALFVNAFAFDSDAFRFLAKNGMLVGMLLIAISKEKIEDELVSNLRMQSFALAFILGVLFSLLQPYLNYFVDSVIEPEKAMIKDTGDFQILWILLSVKVFYFESLKRFHR